MKKDLLLQQLSWSDPFEDFQPKASPNTQSWHYDHTFLESLYQKRPRPEIILEVGSWLGHSAIMAAKYYLTQLNWREFTLICVDTWLGSTEHWLRPESRESLNLHYGQPRIYDDFLSNIALAGLQEYVLPFPQTSINAARVLTYLGLEADWVYLDASHAENDVYLDLNHYWPLVASGGILFGDDWNWPSVRKAVENFCADWELAFEHSAKYSWAIWKV